MGTRHLIIAKIDGERKIAQYGQWDGYLDAKGVTLLEKLHKFDHEKLKESLRKVRFVESQEERERIIYEKSGVDLTGRDLIPMDEAEKISKFAPEFSRDTSANILDLILEGKAEILEDASGFEEEAVFCEFYYIIDFDEGKYKAFTNIAKDIETIEKEEKKHGKENVNEKDDELKLEYDLDDLPSRHRFLEDAENLREAEFRIKGIK